jgi:DNA-binding MarR family transcriptional regulator
MRLSELLKRIGGAVGLTAYSHEFEIMLLLHERGALTASGLYACVGVSASGCHYMLRSLCDRGVVVRAPASDDGRKVIYSLDPDVRATLDEIFSQHHESANPEIRSDAVISTLDLARLHAPGSALTPASAG